MRRPTIATSTGAVRLALAACLMAVTIVALVPTGSASATAYRYWGFYQQTGTTWSFATKGPTQVKPADGSVEGWRFAVADGKTPRMPRATATFARLCAQTKAVSGKKRIGVVIDYGRAADGTGATPPTPVGKCAQVATSATAADVLAAISNVRTSKSLVCAINAYPATGCGDAVKTVSAAAKAKDGTVTLELAGSADKPEASSGGLSTGTWVGIGVIVVALLGLGGVALGRRRSS